MFLPALTTRAYPNILQLSLFVALLILPQLALADGSQSYTSPGTYTFTVPSYASLSVTVNGAGGGGGGGSEEVPPGYNYYGTTEGGYYWIGSNGSAGGGSSFNNSVAAQGGNGGSQSSMSCVPNYSLPNTSYFYYYNCTSPSPVTGSSGGASGAGTNTTGGGASGGTGGQAGACIPGGCPGYAQNAGEVFYVNGGNGGNGGQAVSTYAAGAFSPAPNVTVVVGQGGVGGAGGTGNPTYTTNGSSGQNGSVLITWTSPPSCSVTFNPASPIPFGATTTLAWSSSNATDLYINSIGYVSATGTTAVEPLAATNYSCSAGNGTSTSTSPATLYVGPAAYISQSSPSGYTNNPYSITSTSSNATACTTYAQLPASATTSEWTGTNVTNSTTTTVVGNVSWWNVCSNATSLIATSTLSHSVQNASCTLNGVTVPSGQSYMFFSAQLAPQGQLCSSYSQSRTCTNGVLSGSSSYQYGSCSCAAYDICTGSGNDTITQINADCSETPQPPACVSPEFCQAGSSSCLAPAIPSGPYQNGTHMELIPDLLQSGESTQVRWDVEDAQSCTVTGSNGDGTSGSTDANSPGLWNITSGSETSSPITSQTIYTLSCTAYGSNPGVTESAAVNVVPVFKEI